MASAGCTQHDERPWTGATFPDFNLPDMAGARHRRSDYAGRPLLVNFWATWCPPCRAEMPDLVRLSKRLAPRGLQFLAVSVDDDRWLVAEYLLQEKPDFPVLLDVGHRWSDAAINVAGIPSTYLLDANGVIRAAWLGPRSWANREMQDEIATLAEL